MDALAPRRRYYHPPAVNGSVAYHIRLQENCLPLVMALVLGKTRARSAPGSRVEGVRTGRNNTNTASFCRLTFMCISTMEAMLYVVTSFSEGQSKRPQTLCREARKIMI